METITLFDVLYSIIEIAGIFVAVLLIIILFKIIKILKDVKSISGLISSGAGVLRSDTGFLYEGIKDNLKGVRKEMIDAFKQGGIFGVINLLLSFLYGNKKPKTTNRKSK